MPSLEVVIGLLLIILFYSLLATILMELISNFFALRGKQLERTLKMILSSDDKREEVLEAFRKNAIYQQLSGRYLGKNSPPSYLKAGSFRSILFTVLQKRETGESLEEKIESLPDDNLREALSQILEQANFDFGRFSAGVESWYEDIMDRASGWYKRNVQKYLLGLGFVIAVIFNVDTLSVYNNLVHASDADLGQLVSLAEAVSQKSLYVPAGQADSLGGSNPDTLYALNAELYGYIDANLQGLRDPLGIGWDSYEPTTDLFFWLLKIFGWLITAVAISKGAPFWFDLLSKVVSFRGSGIVPALQKNEAPAAPASPEPISAYRGVSAQGRISGPEDRDEIIKKPVG